MTKHKTQLVYPKYKKGKNSFWIEFLYYIETGDFKKVQETVETHSQTHNGLNQIFISISISEDLVPNIIQKSFSEIGYHYDYIDDDEVGKRNERKLDWLNILTLFNQQQVIRTLISKISQSNFNTFFDFNVNKDLFFNIIYYHDNVDILKMIYEPMKKKEHLIQSVFIHFSTFFLSTNDKLYPKQCLDYLFNELDPDLKIFNNIMVTYKSQLLKTMIREQDGELLNAIYPYLDQNNMEMIINSIEQIVLLESHQSQHETQNKTIL